MSLVGYDASSSDEDELAIKAENKSKLKASSLNSGMKLFELLPKPQAVDTLSGVAKDAGSSKASIRISAPKIVSLDSDDSDEDSKPAKKARVESSSSAQSRSGLFAKLPAPMYVHPGGRKPKTEIHSFTKPKAESEAPSNSLDAPKSKEVKKASNSNDVLSIAEIRKRSAAAAAKLLSTKANNTVPTEAENDSDEDGQDASFFSYLEKVPDDHIAPIVDPEVIYHKVSANHIGPAPDVEYSPPREQEQTSYTESHIPCTNEAVPRGSLMIPDANEILRLQGKRNRNEELNFIDFHEDDALKGGKEMLLKTISEEKGMDRTKVNVPGGMMKKKHQLPYLIQQAKAREVELKNTWAQNRQSKQQTQSKYGW